MTWPAISNQKRSYAPEVLARFWAKVEKTDTCWLWLAALDRCGYGVFMPDAKRSGERLVVRAHRFAYELSVGPIPDGKELHHALERGCISRACVWHGHLDPVTRADHPDSGPAIMRARTVCPQGHLLDGRRSDGKRYCLTCNRDRVRAYGLRTV